MLLELIKKACKIYKPYFGLRRGKPLYHSLLSLLIIIGNVSLAFFMALINAAFDALMAAIVPGVTYRAFFSSTGYFLLVVLAYSGIVSINNWLAERLSTSISQEYNKNTVKRWLKSKAFFGLKFMEQEGATSEAEIISHDSKEVTQNISYLTDNFLMTTSNFIIGLMGLIVLSGPLIFPFMGWSIYIPDYLAVSTVIYALGFNVISGWVGNKLRYQQASKKNAEVNLQQHLHHIKTHAEPVAFLKGESYEHKALKITMRLHHLNNIVVGNIKSLLAFLNSLHQQMASIFGVIISAPNVIEGHMDITGVFQVAHHFGDVVRWFTWRNENLDTISDTLVGLERLEAFEKKLTDWENLKQNLMANEIKINPVAYETPLIFKRVQINTPQGNKMLGPITLSFPKGSITLIQGPSGVGKTTLFRIAAGIWPFAEGEIDMPKNEAGLTGKILFIPQRPYFPYQKTLLDAITYPNNQTTHAVSEQDIIQIKSWMKQLGLKTSTINELNEVREWEKTLSGGEQQRIAVISALYKKPDFLFMDEGTSAMDHHAKTIAEKLIKKVLPNTTIAYIDHNPSPNFNEHTVNFGQPQLQLPARQVITRSMSRRLAAAI
jgi:putative ATP-binding cassette transporter